MIKHKSVQILQDVENIFSGVWTKIKWEPEALLVVFYDTVTSRWPSLAEVILWWNYIRTFPQGRRAQRTVHKCIRHLRYWARSYFDKVGERSVDVTGWIIIEVAIASNAGSSFEERKLRTECTTTTFNRSRSLQPEHSITVFSHKPQSLNITFNNV